MIVAAFAGPRPAYVPVQGDDHDVYSGAARQRYIALKLSNSHRFQYTNASIPYLPTAPFPNNPPEGIEAVSALLVKYLDMKLTPPQAPNTPEHFRFLSFTTRQSIRAAGMDTTQATSSNKYVAYPYYFTKVPYDGRNMPTSQSGACIRNPLID